MDSQAHRPLYGDAHNLIFRDGNPLLRLNGLGEPVARIKTKLLGNVL
jgi:hypothetical protein